MKSIEELEKIVKETKKKYKGKWSKLNESETLKKYLHLKGINTKIQTLKEVLELIDELDLEFAIATNVIEKETGKKVDLPKGMEELMDHYWRYVFSRMKQRISEGERT